MEKKKINLTEEILLRLAGFEDVAKFILNPPRGGIELRYEHIYEARREAEFRWLKSQIKDVFNYLFRSGYLKRRRKGYFLTARGLGKILEIKIKKRIRKYQRLKNKYLVLIFDIPEKKRTLRGFFRRRLRELGFEKIQWSVWATQKDMLKELKALIKLYNLEPYVIFFLAEKI